MHLDADWLTPPEILQIARSVHGEIELDVASSEDHNAHVGAQRFYSRGSDALHQSWLGHWWCNPPYDRSGTQWRFVAHAARQGSPGWVLVKAAVETAGFQPLWGAAALCFISGRLTFGRTRQDRIRDLERRIEVARGAYAELFKVGKDTSKFAVLLTKLEMKHGLLVAGEGPDVVFDEPARWPSVLAYFGTKADAAADAMAQVGTVVRRVA